MTKRLPIKYTSRDFNSIRQDLIEIAKKYYPDTYRDFSEAGFGSFMVDSVSYVGDILSFYLDYQANEAFFDTAVEQQNVLRHSRAYGFKVSNAATTSGVVSLFAIVPSNATGLGPDPTYLPILKKGSQFTSENGSGFILQADARFDDINNDVVVARVDATTGVPTHYAVKTFGTVISGKITQETVSTGEFERFKKLKLGTSKVSEILSVTDDEGHEYSEVDYLSQNVVYKEVRNKGIDKQVVPSIMKPFVVPRRFVLERDKNELYLQFGYGSDSELASPSVADPKNITLELHGKDFISDTSFDPSKLLGTDKFGIVPTNTTLIITMRTNTTDNPNVGAGSLTQVTKRVVDFNDRTIINVQTANEVEASIEVFNEDPIVGNVTNPTSEEIRRRTYDFFATQNRCVSKSDYEAFSYAMPAKFGSIKRACCVRDDNSLKRNLNLYVLAENENGKLTPASMTLKNNLKTWLSTNKEISTTVDILDAKIVNFGVEVVVVGNPENNKFDTQKEAIKVLEGLWQNSLMIGEPIDLSVATKALNKLKSVIAVRKLKVIPKFGSPYSNTKLDFNTQTSTDGQTIYSLNNVAYELKFPSADIKVSVT